MYYRIAVVLIFVFSIVGIASAQDGEEPSCTVEEYQDGIQTLIDTMEEFKPQIVVEDDALSLLIGIDSLINSFRAGCTGANYSSVDYPNGIIEPISFSGVLYQAEFTATTFGSLTFVPIVGDCGREFMTISEVDGDTETDLWEFGGDCMTMFEIEGGGDWTLTIEKLR